MKLYMMILAEKRAYNATKSKEILYYKVVYSTVATMDKTWWIGHVAECFTEQF